MKSRVCRSQHKQPFVIIAILRGSTSPTGGGAGARPGHGRAARGRLCGDAEDFHSILLPVEMKESWSRRELLERLDGVLSPSTVHQSVSSKYDLKEPWRNPGGTLEEPTTRPLF